jgi:hypothetical protein
VQHPEDLVVEAAFAQVAEEVLVEDHSSAVVEVDILAVTACIGHFQEAPAEEDCFVDSDRRNAELHWLNCKGPSCKGLVVVI